MTTLLEYSTSLEDLLSSALSPDTQTISKAMTLLQKAAMDNFSLFLHQCGNILSSELKPPNIRQLAAILMKNCLLHIDQLQNVWRSSLSKEDKAQMKLLVLSSLASNSKEVRSATSTVIASICKIDQPIKEHWPDLIISLTQNAFNVDINLRLAAIETLGYVCEELTLKGIDIESVDHILSAIIRNISDSNVDINILTQCLKALRSMIKLAKKNFRIESERKVILDAIFTVIKQHQNEDAILEKIALLFIEMFSISDNYDYLSSYINNIIEFAFYVINAKNAINERFCLFGIEILCSIGDEEALRKDKKGEIVIEVTKEGDITGGKHSHHYFNCIWKELRDMILKYVSIPKEDEDDNDWTLSKGCLCILNIMMKVIDKKYIEDFIKMLSIQIFKEDNDVDTRCKCWLLMGSSLNANDKDAICNLITRTISKIENDIDTNNDIRLQKTAMCLLERISKRFPKSFAISQMNDTISKLLKSLKVSSPSISYKICSTLRNIIKKYGDKNTDRNTNLLSGHFKRIIQSLFVPAVTELSPTADTKLTFQRIITIDTLIANASHDRQKEIKEAFMQYLHEIEFTYNSHNELIAKGVNKEIIYQLQDYYYTLIHTILLKMKEKVTKEECNSIWILTKNIFSLRQTVFEEANCVLGLIADKLKGDFLYIYNDYLPYLIFAIKSTEISSLSRSGLMALHKIILVLNKEICPSSAQVIPALIDVCTSSDISRGNKLLAIVNIGDIAFQMEKKFAKYLDPVMSLLFSACQMGVTVSEETDEDTVEYIKDLHFELVQTFTALQFAMDTQKEILVPYIPHIYSFYSSIVSDGKRRRNNALEAMLSFMIDSITIYGREFVSMCDKSFADALIGQLRSVSVNQLELDTNEKIINILYNN